MRSAGREHAFPPAMAPPLAPVRELRGPRSVRRPAAPQPAPARIRDSGTPSVRGEWGGRAGSSRIGECGIRAGAARGGAARGGCAGRAHSRSDGATGGAESSPGTRRRRLPGRSSEARRSSCCARPLRGVGAEGRASAFTAASRRVRFPAPRNPDPKGLLVGPRHT